MEITDPTDWPSSMTELRTIDNLLRCSICYEFLKTAMILPGCSHNFCSLCIRRYLSHESKCPTCKKPTSVPELKNNRVLDELSKNFVAVRPHILKLCLENDAINSPKPQNSTSLATPSTSLATTSTSETTPRRSSRSNKRQASYESQETSSSDEAPAPKSSPTKQSSITRHFRSKAKDARLSRAKDAHHSQTAQSSDDDFVTVTPSRNTSVPSTQSSLNRSNEENISPDVADEDCMIVDDGDGDKGAASTSSDHANSQPQLSSATKKDKASCPVCGVSVQPKYINAHLDSCLLKGDKRESKRRTPKQKPKRKPLPKLVYNLMSDKDIRKKLKEFNLPHQGNKQVMVKRLQEFTLLYNAECDSDSPRPVEALVKEVEKMEKVKVQPPSKREQRVTRLKVEKGQSEEEMEKHQNEYLKAHKNQFDKLIQEAKERMKKAHVRMPKKKASNLENGPSTSTSLQINNDDDENSRDSVTITEIKLGTDAKLTDTNGAGDKIVTSVNSENLPTPEGAGQDNNRATKKIKQTVKENATVIEAEKDNAQDDDTGNEDDNSKHNARVSLSFAGEGGIKKTEVKEMKEGSTKPSSSSTISSPPPAGGDEEPENMDQGSSSTESMENRTDESLEEPGSPSLLSSQAVLGDSTNYSVSIHNESNSKLGHSGLLDTLMSDNDEKPSTSNETAVLVPPSPSATSKAGDDVQADANQLDGSEPSRVEDDSPLQDSVDLNCIPESPQPSTSGIRQRKRRKVDTYNNSESGSSVGDDSVGLRRSSRRNKKTKPNA
ncbi:uncharacterized protein [Amphiura filiformis]|uniref:uncharacterized protein n=1 Tax=Amphiura filiformis TaxID=82378 RepID=UPI003B216D42